MGEKNNQWWDWGLDKNISGSFPDSFSLMLGKPRLRLNNLKTSLRVPCLGLNPITDSISLQLKNGKSGWVLTFSMPNNGLDLVGWLVVLGLTAFETVFQSISSRLPKRGRKRRERIDESKNVQTTPTRTYYKRSRPLPYCNPNCRTPRNCKFTQLHRTTRPPPMCLNHYVLDILHRISNYTGLHHSNQKYQWNNSFIFAKNKINAYSFFIVIIIYQSYRKYFIYSRLSLSRSRRDPLKHFELSVLRHIRFAELRKIPIEHQISQMNM